MMLSFGGYLWTWPDLSSIVSTLLVLLLFMKVIYHCY